MTPSQLTVGELGLCVFCGEARCPLRSVGRKAVACGGAGDVILGADREGAGRNSQEEKPQKWIKQHPLLDIPQNHGNQASVSLLSSAWVPTAESSSGTSTLLAVALTKPSSEWIQDGWRC